ncbi:MAG: thioredoxin TrxC [Gammaproteobacteria bacterium]|nr:thioredoxin TrxC [Gammaproteobacteria bacterium]MDH5692314.1 thioredoxin TrxC [Gammaproteobacteria bacterium]
MTHSDSFSQIVCPHCQSLNRVPSNRLDDEPKCGKCKNTLFHGKPLSLSTAEFERLLQKDSTPILVDFWAPWCGPCRMMAPQFEQAASRLEPKVRLVKINTEEETSLGMKYQIRSIPTLALFKNGQEIARQPGAMGAADIERWARQQL